MFTDCLKPFRFSLHLVSYKYLSFYGFPSVIAPTCSTPAFSATPWNKLTPETTQRRFRRKNVFPVGKTAGYFYLWI